MDRGRLSRVVAYMVDRAMTAQRHGDYVLSAQDLQKHRVERGRDRRIAYGTV